MRIDAHQHYWKLSRGDYGWLSPDMTVLYRDYQPADLEPQLEKHEIERTIAVQAAPTVAETEYLLDLAERHESIAGVVGWLDLEGDRFEEELDRLSERPKFVGVRPMLQDIDDVDWVLRPQVVKNLGVLAKRGLTLDFLIRPRHLNNALEIVRRIPELKCVVDHIAKPDIKSGALDPWREKIARLAEHPNVYCKLSGMVTEADHANWTVDDLRPFVRHAVECFGYDRVMFGSDWPVCLLAATYDQVVEACRELLSDGLTPKRERAVFGENAARFYGVE